MTLLPSMTQYLQLYHSLVEKEMTDLQHAVEEYPGDETGDAEADPVQPEHEDEELVTLHAGADHQQGC